MPRAQKKQGGKRQGTPSKGYSNRTDLMTNYDMSDGTPAAGPIEPVAEKNDYPAPESLPNLTDPTRRPGEPITSGLPIGPGDGPPMGNQQADMEMLRQFLPLIEPVLNAPDTPDSVRMLYRYIRSGG